MKIVPHSSSAADRKTGYWLLLLGTPLSLALTASLLIPRSYPQPAYLQYAEEYATTGRITATTYPLEFAWLTGISIKAFGESGPSLLQTSLYFLIVISVWILARRCGCGWQRSLCVALMAAFYPQLLVSVTKIWDVELAVLLMVSLMLFTVLLLQKGFQLPLVFGTALVMGLGFAQRSNMLLLFPLPMYCGWLATRPLRGKLFAVALGSVSSVLVLGIVNTLAHGALFFAQNGPYNLVQGHNEYSIQVMLKDLSSEPTVPLLLKADNMGYSDGITESDEADPKLQHYFVDRALKYMATHPIEEVKITAVKILTIFRPDMKVHSSLSLSTVSIVAMSCIFPIWLVVLFRQKIRSGLDTLDWAFVFAVVLYTLPFILTASDPRYQIPIEITLLPHIARMTRA